MVLSCYYYNCESYNFYQNGDIVISNSGDVMRLKIDEDNGRFYFQFTGSENVLTAVKDGDDYVLKAERLHFTKEQQFTLKDAREE